MYGGNGPQRSVITAVLLWRFFTGHHMDGKRRKNYASGKVLPQYRDYAWNRLTRPQRAWWRLLVIWALSLLGYGLVVHRAATLYVLVASIPFVVAFMLYRAVQRFTVRSNFTHDGVTETHRTLRPKYYRRLMRLRRWRFKLRPPTDEAIPPDWERPIKAQLAEDGVAPVTTLRRPLQPPMDIDELLAQNGPKDSRGATHRRNAKRRLGK